jgi:hypothetical protein
MTTSEELQSLQMTAINLKAMCRVIIDNIDDNTLTVEHIEWLLNDLEVGDYSLYSALNNCIEPVGY